MYDDKTFWATIKPLFTDKAVNQDRIFLVKENETILDNDKISEKVNNFFEDIVKHLKIPQNKEHLVNTDHIDDSILRAKEKFEKFLIKCYSENKNNSLCSSSINTEIEKESKN